MRRIGLRALKPREPGSAHKRRLLAIAAQACVLACALAVPPACAGQGAVTTSFSSQSWTLDLDGSEAAFRQNLFSVSFDLPQLRGPFGLRGYVPFASTSDETEDAKLSGLGDTQLRLAYRREGSPWSATAGIDLPTGKTGLSTDEYIVASRILASRVLDFGLKRPGEGLDLTAGIASATAIGRNTVLGLAVAGYLKGEYTMYEGESESRLKASPGSRVHASLSLLLREHDVDPVWDLSTALGVQLAAASELTQNGATTRVREGPQASLEGTYGRRMGDAGRLAVSLYLLGRGSNELEDGDLPAAEILGISTRWVTELGASYTRMFPDLADLTAGFSHAVYRNDATGGVNSRMTGLELRAARALGQRWRGEISLRKAFGRTPWTSADDATGWKQRGLSGMQAGLALEGTF